MTKHLTELLNDFIDVAQKSRKYNLNAASGLRTALRLFEKELNEEEQSSLPVFRQNFNQIYQQVLNKNLSSYTAESLDVYKRRIVRLLRDYEQYGVDRTKMATWNPTVRIVKRNKKVIEQAASDKNTVQNEDVEEQNHHTSGMKKWELPSLDRSGVSAVVYTAPDLTQGEMVMIKAYINYLEQAVNKSDKSE